jgi:hypothetical protein
VDVIGTFDRSGLNKSEYGISAVGTFRIAGETDEHKQPMFNLAMIDCEKQSDDRGRVSVECKVTQAAVYANPDKPNADDPNCSLDLDVSTYSMKELQRGVLTGMEESSSACFNTILTIDRNTKRVYRSFTKTTSADKYDQIRSGTCGMLPPTQVLMNCTAYPRMRKLRQQGQVPPRYCDFSSYDDVQNNQAPAPSWQNAPIVTPAAPASSSKGNQGVEYGTLPSGVIWPSR